MVNKLSNGKKGVILSVVFALAMVSLASFSYISYAWFASQRTASVNFANMQISQGLTYTLYSFNGNEASSSSTTNNGYKLSDAATLAPTGSTYTSLFKSIDVSTDEGLKQLGKNAVFSPSYASTFVVEVKNNDTYGSHIGLYLKAFTASVTSNKYHSSDTSKPFSLAEPMEVYTGFSDGSNLDADAVSFLQGTMSDSLTNRFTVTEPGDLANPLDWGSDLSRGTSISSDGTCYFFVTFYFSNDPSTFYSYSSTTGDDSYYTQSNTGDSNVYENLTMAFTSLAILPLD
jgi:hypothetical protein